MTLKQLVLTRPTRLAALLLATSAPAPAIAQGAAWDGYASNGSSVFVPFSSRASNDTSTITTTPTVSLKIGGNSADFIVDTGSTGIAIGAKATLADHTTPLWTPNTANGDQYIGSGAINYNSSDIYLTGQMWRTTVSLTDSTGGIVKVQIPVLYVTKETDKGADVDPKTTMMGVGFGRVAAGFPNGTPEVNPLLNVSSVSDGNASTLSRGYIITRNGIQIGLTAQSTAGTTLIKLLADPANSDKTGTEWQMTPATINAGGASGVGTLLPDTGRVGAYVIVPDGSTLPRDVKQLQSGEITVYVPGGSGTQGLIYSFRVDGHGALVPVAGTTSEKLKTDPTGNVLPIVPYLNTTVAILNGFNLIYDAESGFSGFQQTTPQTNKTWAVPSLNLQGSLTLGSGLTTTLPVYLFADTTLQPMDTATLAGPVSGPGGLAVAGGGTLRLIAQNTYSGQTTVAGSTLVVNGSASNSTVAVADGGVVGGFGSIGGLWVARGAAAAPGIETAFSRLTVMGDARFDPGSTLQVHANASGQSDTLAVNGQAVLNGGTVSVLAQNGDYKRRTGYAILTATGGVTGRFAGTVTNLAFLTPSLSYAANTVTLTLRRNDQTFGSTAGTTNQRSVAAALDRLLPVTMQGNGTASPSQAASTQAGGSDEALPAAASPGPNMALADASPGLSPLQGALLDTTASQARAAYDALSGVGHAGAVTAGLEGAHVLSDTVLDRLNTIAGSDMTSALAAVARFGAPDRAALPELRGYAAETASPVPVPSPLRVWGTGFGAFGRNGGGDGTSSLSRTLGGFVLGADTRLDLAAPGAWHAGLLGGYTNTRFAVKGLGTSGTYENVFGGVYAGTRQGAIDVKVGATAGGAQTNIRRVVTFASFSESEKASYGGALVQGFGELGYRVALGASVVEPIVAAAAIHVVQDGFGERGGSAALTGARSITDVQTTTVGLRGETPIMAGWPVLARTLLGWRHAFGDVSPSLALAFAGQSGSFTVTGPAIARDAAVGEVGFDYLPVTNVRLGLSYLGQAGARASDNAVKGRFEVAF